MAQRQEIVSNKCDGKEMDSLIGTAARALAAGDPLAALKRIALRDDAPALALRGIAMAQLGDLARAKELLGNAARTFGTRKPMARARCNLALAEIALVTRDLGRPMEGLGAARSTLEEFGDLPNAAHAGYLEARRLLLIGRLDEAERTLDDFDAGALPVTSRAGYELVVAGIAIRRIRAKAARDALDRATNAAANVGNAALTAEVDRAMRAFEAPVARLVTCNRERLLRLDEVEALIASDTLIIDACRTVVRAGSTAVSLASRPVLFALVRVLSETWPGDASREELLFRAFRARAADESHRARLRVEIGRLREAIKPLAEIHATEQGFVLDSHAAGEIAVLAPPVENEHGEVLALLADGEAWSSSALALALDVSPRTVQRSLDTLAENGKAEWFGQGRARRWIATSVPGFPTSLLLPAIGGIG
jgi:tetratricopeptide (TPR) repeat protein